jgi:hypothetical protein
VHAVATEQDTEFSALPSVPAGLAVDWTAHAVPFQRSARVTTTPELTADPAAVQLAADRQDTPASCEEEAPGAPGPDCSAHWLPFQDSASGDATPELSTE